MRPTIVALVVLFSATAAFADYDPAQEARDNAQRDAARRAQQQKQQEMQRQRQDAEAKANAAMNAETMKSRRKALGAAADGKSDAEVNRLYDAKLSKDTEASKQSAAAARSALSQGEGAAAVKSVTGKSMQEIEKMSDAELEALSREMEKKYK